MQSSLLAFSIGPVQEFIAAARTTRDLWTGSYLLSWLTANVMSHLHKGGGVKFIIPNIAENPLFQAASGRPGQEDARVLLPSIPQTFLASVEADLETTRQKCYAALQSEWRSMSTAVREVLDRRWRGICADWSARWDHQVDKFWDVRVVALPSGQPDDALLTRLLGSGGRGTFHRRREYLARVAAADKAIRHYLPHEFDDEGQGDTRPKCSLLGNFAQMGPLAPTGQSQMAASREFWAEVLKDQRSKGPICGARLSSRDRLCAVSLVKRFAWGAYLAKRLHRDIEEMRFPDTDTVCASNWLAWARNAGHFDADKARTESGKRYFSGRWLRWQDRLEGQRSDDPDAEECPDESTWNAIVAARKEAKRDGIAAPSAYFAVLMLDGDDLGQLARDADEGQLNKLSATLARFASSDVRDIVERHHGTLVYAGGDDVLALLSPTAGLACAQALANAYQLALDRSQIAHPGGAAPTTSAGLVIAHCRANLREVLQAARDAERQAKQEGKNRLALAILRRSGEHSLASCQWPHVARLAELVGLFQTNSNRWTYRYLQVLDALPDVPDARTRELLRLLERAEGCSPDFAARIRDLWRELNAQADVRSARSFVQLVQSASFLARPERD